MKPETKTQELILSGPWSPHTISLSSNPTNPSISTVHRRPSPFLATPPTGEGSLTQHDLQPSIPSPEPATNSARTARTTTAARTAPSRLLHRFSHFAPPPAFLSSDQRRAHQGWLDLRRSTCEQLRLKTTRPTNCELLQASSSRHGQVVDHLNCHLWTPYELNPAQNQAKTPPNDRAIFNRGVAKKPTLTPATFAMV